MELSVLQLKEIINTASRNAADQALAQAGLLKEEITQAEAFRIHGRARVESWCNQGLVKRIKTGEGKNCKVTYSRAELNTAKLITTKQ